MTKKQRTAGQYLAERGNDPNWIARRQADDAEQELHLRAIALAEADILRDLADAGVDVESISMLGALPNNGPAVGVLLRQLQGGWSKEIRLFLASVIAESACTDRWREIVAAYLRENDQATKEQLARALAMSVDATTISQLVDLAEDAEGSSNRAMLLSVFAPMSGRGKGERRELYLLVHDRVDRLKMDPEVGQALTDALLKIDELPRRRNVLQREAIGPAEVSISVDEGELPALMHALVQGHTGLTNNDANAIVETASSLTIEQETSQIIDVPGRMTTVVHLFVGDVGVIDVQILGDLDFVRLADDVIRRFVAADD